MKVTAVSLHRLIWSTVASFLLLAPISATAQVRSQDNGDAGGKVYVLSNVASGNTIIVFNRDSNGSLTRLEEVSTGGFGSGPGALPPPAPPNTPGPDPLQSQDALIMTKDGHFLLAVNAGSNDISVLKVDGNGLTLTDKQPSGGLIPASIAEYQGLVYVLNEGNPASAPFAGGTATVTGFSLDNGGKLHAVPNSTTTIGVNAGAADILFSPNGKYFVVAEQLTNTLDVFSVKTNGLLGDRTTIQSDTPTPFGATFGADNILAVTQIDVIVVNGRRQGVLNGSTTSTYRLSDAGSLEPVSKSVATNRTGSCWIRFTPDGRFAYSGDTGSGTVSIMSVDANGNLALAGFASTGGRFSVPLDLDITPNGKFLYVIAAIGEVSHIPPRAGLPANAGRIQGYQIEHDGTLIPVTTVGDIPFAAQGIVAR